MSRKQVESATYWLAITVLYCTENKFHLVSN